MCTNDQTELNKNLIKRRFSTNRGTPHQISSGVLAITQLVEAQAQKATMRVSLFGNGFILLILVLFFHAYSAFPSRTDERNLANNEKYQLLKELLPTLKEIAAEDKFIEEKRNQEVMSAFNNMRELKEILRSG